MGGDEDGLASVEGRLVSGKEGTGAGEEVEQVRDRDGDTRGQGSPECVWLKDSIRKTFTYRYIPENTKCDERHNRHG
jgi:hypothetical protein